MRVIQRMMMELNRVSAAKKVRKEIPRTTRKPMEIERMMKMTTMRIKMGRLRLLSHLPGRRNETNHKPLVFLLFLFYNYFDVGEELLVGREDLGCLWLHRVGYLASFVE
ncbi:hypothetical protein V6N13_058237 [Hibiscus sabdariffa]